MKIVAASILVVLIGTCLGAQEPETPDVDTIVKKANQMAYYQGKDGKAKVNMTITAYEKMDDKGNPMETEKKDVRTREFVVLRSDVEDGGDQNYYVYFQKPADVRGMVFLVLKHADSKQDDDRYLYLPALDLVKRIAAGDKRTSFIGSDFLYEDVSGRSLQEDKHELVETTDQYYVIKNTPLHPDTVEFQYYNVSVDRKNLMPVRMEYFDKNGTFFRRVEAIKIETIQDYPTVTLSRVTDITKKSTTEMEFSDVKYDIDLKDIFSERYLRRPPREATR
jgi:hypothetical protein